MYCCLIRPLPEGGLLNLYTFRGLLGLLVLLVLLVLVVDILFVRSIKLIKALESKCDFYSVWGGGADMPYLHGVVALKGKWHFS